MAGRKQFLLVLVLFGAVVAFYLFDKKQNSSNPLSQLAVPTEAKEKESLSSKEAHEVRMASSTVAQTKAFNRSASRSSAAVKNRQINTSQARLEKNSLFAESNWKIWSGVSAIAKSKGTYSGTVLGEVSGYVLIEDGGPSDISNFSSSRPLVVVDTRLNTVGVVTGVFEVVLKVGASPELFAQHGLKVVNSFPNIRTYYVTAAQEPFDLRSLQEFLRNEPAALEVQMEILSRQYDKN